jgi:integrase
LDDREITAVCAVMGSADWLPFWIALETGLRIGDVAKLRWEEISGNTITFVAQKTGKRGTAVISDDLRRALQAARHRKQGDWLFPSPLKRGEHITRQSLWRKLKRACARAGVNPEGFSPHSFRKVYAVDLLNKYGDIAKVQRALNHSGVTVTMVYAMADKMLEAKGRKRRGRP